MRRRSLQPKAKSQLPPTIDEARALARAHSWLVTIRAADFLRLTDPSNDRATFQLGDPFNDDAMHELLRRTFKGLADLHPRNATRVLQFALAGVEEADQALKDLISERNTRGEPLGHALATYTDILAYQGTRQARRPVGRQRGNFLANWVIVCLLLDLRKHLGLPLKRRTSRRPSCCSVVAEALTKIGIGRGGEDAIWKIWRDYGPPVCPATAAKYGASN
jgi:hypothetical protein